MNKTKIDTALIVDRTEEITKLHQEIVGHLRTSLDKAIKIGELLTEQKALLKHGQFTKWAAGLPFSDRTSRRYMKLFEHRDELKTDSVSDLTTAYKLLTQSPTLIEANSLPDLTDIYAQEVGWNYDIELLRQMRIDCGIQDYTRVEGERLKEEIATCESIPRLSEIHKKATRWHLGAMEFTFWTGRKLGEAVLAFEKTRKVKK